MLIYSIFLVQNNNNVVILDGIFYTSRKQRCRYIPSIMDEFRQLIVKSKKEHLINI